MVMKQCLELDPKLFLAKIKENRKKIFSMVEKLAEHSVLFKQHAKEFSNIAKNLISAMKSTDDHTVYLNSIVETELIIFSLNVMLKSSGARHILVEKELFASLNELDQSLNSISPPFNDATLRELSIQHQNRDQHNSIEQDPGPVGISNDNNDIKSSVTNPNEENCQILSCVNNNNNVIKADCSSSTEQSKRKSLKRVRKLSSNDEECLTCK
ncbi:unnamed protein product [Schistosoma haematobium]|nr:unnamed protein product [Schistosoma haematobium]